MKAATKIVRGCKLNVSNRPPSNRPAMLPIVHAPIASLLRLNVSRSDKPAGEGNDSSLAAGADPGAAEDGEEQPEWQMKRADGEDTECSERQRASQHTLNSYLVHEGRGHESPR
jgi:hypothetical protein